jgi:ubiquinone/menaquinone biosynthesis C-methylase UbiE
MNENYAKKIMDENRKGYDLIADHFSQTRTKIWEEIESFLRKNISKEDKVLDIGCGDGRFCKTFENYTGVDFSKELVDKAKKKYPGKNFLKADALSLPFSNGSFDKVFSIAVFHHIPSRNFRIRFLKEAKRVLKKEGRLILTVWKPKGKKYFFYFLKNLFKFGFRDVIVPWKDPSGEVKFNRYYHFFSKKELNKVINRAGFKIEDSGVLENKTKRRTNFYFILKK